MQFFYSNYFLLSLHLNCFCNFCIRIIICNLCIQICFNNFCIQICFYNFCIQICFCNFCIQISFYYYFDFRIFNCKNLLCQSINSILAIVYILLSNIKRKFDFYQIFFIIFLNLVLIKIISIVITIFILFARLFYFQNIEIKIEK